MRKHIFASAQSDLKALAGALVALLSAGVQNATAQEDAASAGCMAANAGEFDFSIPAATSLTSSTFTRDFSAGDVLTFVLSAGGGGVDSSLVEDVTDDVEILNSIAETSADYTIPADGSREFNLELETTDFGAEISATCAPAEGSITITKASDTDGDFNFSGDLGNFTISVFGEPGSSFFTELTPGEYRVTEEIDPEFELSSLNCVGDTDNGSVIDIANGEVVIDLDGGESITCTFTNGLAPDVDAPPTPDEIVEISQHAIRNFLYRRTNLLLSEEPDRARIVRKNPGLLWSDTADINIQADSDGVDANFAVSTANAWGNAFDIWVEGHYSSYRTDNGGDAEGDFGVIYIGTDYLLSEDVLIGMLGQIDWISESSAAMGEDIDGDGWMVGPYLSARLDENVFFDARAAWGRSSNSLSIAGFVTDDEFETSRWLVRGALTGNKQFGKWRVTPTAAVAYIEETQESYVSNTGVAVGEQTVALGRFTIEPELAYRHVTRNGTLIEPQFRLAGVWDFETPDGLSIPGWAISTDKFRMRAEGGFMVALTNGFAFRVAGNYDGIGASGYEAYGAMAWLDIPIGKKRRTSRSRPPELKQCADGTMVPLADGCPLAAPQDIATTVSFKDGKPALTDGGYAALAEAWSEAAGYDITSIEIDPGAGGSVLSDQRAEAIRAALVELGAPEDLMVVTGPSGADVATVIFNLR